MPIWANEDFSEMICIGSVEELETLTGTKVTDLHRENIDHLEIKSKTG
jgi:isoleucyl-tRNA synthetase